MKEKCSQEFMDLLGLEETLDRLAKAKEIRWYGHVLSRHNDDVLKKTLVFEVVGRKRGRSNLSLRVNSEKSVRQMAVQKTVMISHN